MTPAHPRLYLDPARIDWSRVSHARYEVRQTLSYVYPGPIDDVHQVLIVVPPDQIGGQRLLAHAIAVEPSVAPRYTTDQFGNRVAYVMLPRVERRLKFTISMQIERVAERDGEVAGERSADRYLVASPLTDPFPALQQQAERMRRETSSPVELATRINHWVYQHITYRQGVTDISTTARDAFEERQGVCQDYAHLMIALSRLCGIPARYVSGHLLGEGAMHAWVQVLLPDADGAARRWQPFDPTHDRPAGMSYLTIAIGRDFGDVSPTRGTFRAAFPGRLAGGAKQAGVLEVRCA